MKKLESRNVPVIHSQAFDNPGVGRHYVDLAGTHSSRRQVMADFIRRILSEDQAQDIAEYAVMLAVILVLVVGTLRLIGSNANNAFSSAASSIQ
jgi:Flp pilus assembly pilin Flp